MTQPAHAATTPRRIASLDGLRALSIAMVLVGHAALSAGLSPFVFSLLDVGTLGVRVFFVISGFLITKLLLDELRETGTVNLSRFYARRVLRIFPPYYAYLLLALVWDRVGSRAPALTTECLTRAMTYTSNYGRACTWDLAHSWSLSVEEQFYVGWPLLLVTLAPRSARAVVGALLAAAPIVRLLIGLLAPTASIMHRFETVGDALAMGCLLATLNGGASVAGPLSRVLSSRAFGFIPLAALALHLLGPHPRAYANQVALYQAFAPTAINLCIMLTIAWTLHHASGRVARMLNARPMVMLGGLSYSLYLWQQPFMDPARMSAGPWWRQLAVNFLCALACALISQQALERPVLALRARIGWLRGDARAPAATATSATTGDVLDAQREQPS